MSGILELGPDGWVRDGRPWSPDAPFYGVMGDPIDHSLSPVMQRAALAERGLDHEYLPILLHKEQVGRLKELPEYGGLAGFNVTAPLKETLAAACDDLTDAARQLEAVNTVKVHEGSWHGHNTDSGGIESVLVEAFPGDGRPAKAVVLGTGGSARAAVDALTRWGVEEITVQARSAQGHDRFEDWLRRREDLSGVSIEPLPDESPGAPQDSAVWICCLAGGVDATAYQPVAAGSESAFCLDLRYGTQLAGTGAPLGFGFSDGLPVLLMQGVLSFAWWFGPPIPLQKMRDALV